jgi:hypothetical protein
MVAVAVLLVLILGWQLLPGGGDDRPPAAGAAGSGTPSAGPSTSLAATPPSGDPGRPAGSAGTATATTTAPAAGPPTPTPGPTTPAPTTPAPPPRPCADGALALRVGPQQPAYRVGQTPVLDLQIRNASRAACVRDLGAAQQEILLYAGARRLWSSNDCYPEGQRDPEVLAPGTTRSFTVTWSGLSSQPRCAGPRARVGPGTYQLEARVGTLVSRRATLVLR